MFVGRGVPRKRKRSIVERAKWIKVLGKMFGLEGDTGRWVSLEEEEGFYFRRFIGKERREGD